MSNRFFDGQSFVWKPFGYIADVLLLSMLWFLCSIPLITMGAATAALYDAVARGMRANATDTYSRFFRTLKAELFRSMPSTLLWAAVIGLGCYGIKSFTSSAAAGDVSYVLAVACFVLLMIPIGIACWVFPLLSRFTFGFAGLNITAAKLAISNILRTLALAAISTMALWVSARYIMLVFISPALLALLWSCFMEPVFRKYEDTGE